MTTQHEQENISRKGWLASLGACTKSLNITSDTLDKLYVDGNILVSELIARGEKVETQLANQINHSFGAKTMIDEKIAALKAKLGMQSESREQQLERLSNKVDNLIDVVAKLAQQKAAEQAAAKKAAASKPASTKTTTAAKTTTTRKTTASKSTTASKPASTTKAPAKPRTRRAPAKKPAAGKSE